MKAFPNPHRTDELGMTLRDYMAAQAMQGLIASPRGTPDGKDATDAYYAKVAYVMADAMLKVRESCKLKPE